jgi:glycogen debranching enzyme
MTETVERYYIPAPEVPVPERLRVLKHDETCGLFNDSGDIDAHARHEEGIYHRGTRFLSRLTLKLMGARPLLLSSAVHRDNLLMSADLTNPDLYVNGQVVVPRGSLHVYRSKLIRSDTCHERIHVRNFINEPLDIVLAIEFAADYADIFEVRGQQRPRRGRLLDPRTGANYISLGYEGLDGIERHTRLECNPEPHTIGKSEIKLQVRLDAHSEQVFCVDISCESAPTGTKPAVRTVRPSQPAAIALAQKAHEEQERAQCVIDTSNQQLNAWIDRSTADLRMLLTSTPTGLYPYAGVPWFDTTFGRDGIITALECLWLTPDIARGVLTFLAQTQAKERDANRDAEPGKILHEARSGEMAALGEVPFGCYYGSVDATPLFVMLAGAYFRRTGDETFLQSLWPHVVAAIEWLPRSWPPPSWRKCWGMASEHVRSATPPGASKNVSNSAFGVRRSGCTHSHWTARKISVAYAARMPVTVCSRTSPCPNMPPRSSRGCMTISSSRAGVYVPWRIWSRVTIQCPITTARSGRTTMR